MGSENVKFPRRNTKRQGSKEEVYPQQKKKKKTKEKVERKKRCGALAHTKNKKRLDIFIFQDRENELTKNKIK